MYVSNGAGSGTWATADALGSGAAGDGQILVSDGSGGLDFQSVHGWSYYQDNAAAQTFTTSASKLSIDGLGANTELSFMPSDAANFWDTAADKLIAGTVGNSYMLRLDLPISNVTGSASILQLQLDIGGGASPTIPIVTRQISIAAGSNKTVSVSFGYFTLATFLANGGQIFLSTDANTADVTAPAIFIQRVSRG